MQITCPNCQCEIEVNAAALLGSTTSKAKARAARRNAKLGGWPKGKKRGPRKLDANSNAHRIVREAEKLTQRAQVPPSQSG